jgi:hypothetical protein
MSGNYGQTWTKIDSAQQPFLQCVSISNDGTYLLINNNNGLINIAYTLAQLSNLYPIVAVPPLSNTTLVYTLIGNSPSDAIMVITSSSGAAQRLLSNSSVSTLSNSSWTSTPLSSYQWNGIVGNTTLTQYVAYGQSYSVSGSSLSSTSSLFTSPDGTNWTQSSIAPGVYNSFAWDSTMTNCMAVTNSSFLKEIQHFAINDQFCCKSKPRSVFGTFRGRDLIEGAPHQFYLPTQLR